MKKLIVPLVMLLSQFFIGCDSREGCQYQDSIQLYFKSTFNIDFSEIEGSRAFYFIPLESCENCIYSNLLTISKINSRQLMIIFVGENYHTEWDSLLVEIKSRHKFLEDEEKLIYEYESGLGKPLLFTIKDGDCFFSKTIHEEQLPELSKELEKL